MHDFVRRPHFTERSFFSESGTSKLTAAIAVAGDVCAPAAFDPWESFPLCSSFAIVADLMRSRERLLLRHISLKNIRE